MSKAVLISIRPKWVEKIANGEKTIEVRKTKPKGLDEFTRLRETKFGSEPVTIKRPPQSWCYVEAIKDE